MVNSENIFGNYYEKGDLIARNNMASVEEQDDPLTNPNRYVLADITSFFTLLVGIYFPSVTGERCFHKLLLSFDVSVLLIALIVYQTGFYVTLLILSKISSCAITRVD